MEVHHSEHSIFEAMIPNALSDMTVMIPYSHVLHRDCTCDLPARYMSTDIHAAYHMSGQS